MKNSFSFKKHIQNDLPLSVILTAIKTEFQAVISHIENHCEYVNDRGTVYEYGIFNATNGQSWNIVIVECGKGNLDAASEVNHAIIEFQPALILFIGVAGSLKKT